MSRTTRQFEHRGAAFNISCDQYDAVTAEIVQQREQLEAYIDHHPAFVSAMTPIDLLPGAPAVACRMGEAGRLAGVGPMAAVAGAMAECAARAGLAAGAREAIVDNGGDVFLSVCEPVMLGLYAGATPLADRLALLVMPAETPLAICSSSGRMGRSFSFGDCDLATVAARDGALADAAATRAGNMVRTADDIDLAMRRVMAIPGVLGVLLVKGDKVGVMGRLPELVRNRAARGEPSHDGVCGPLIRID